MRENKTEKQISENPPAYDKQVLIHIIYCKMQSSGWAHTTGEKIKIIDLILLLFQYTQRP